MSEPGDGNAIDPKDLPPLLLNVDVNKSIIISDKIMMKSVEYTIREVIANQFWGFEEPPTSGATQGSWIWDGRGPSLDPQPRAGDPGGAGAGEPRGGQPSVNYLKFCRKIEDKNMARLATRSFDLVHDPECKQQMVEVSDAVVREMVIPAAQRTEELAAQTELTGEWKLVFPSFFRFVAYMQRSGRRFSVFFRSFGTDLPRVRAEWNAFCELRHPLYKDLLDGTAMDGSVPGVPDRRLAADDSHTMYRDAQGPLIAMNILTNGNWEGEWDQWARTPEEEDTRNGRAFFQDNGIKTLQGYPRIQAWVSKQLNNSKTQVIRDDFAWWHKHGETSRYGKLMLGLRGSHQLFLDDNIGSNELRIVNPISAYTYEPVPEFDCAGSICIRIDTLQAMLDKDYFINLYETACRTPGQELLHAGVEDAVPLEGSEIAETGDTSALGEVDEPVVAHARTEASQALDGRISCQGGDANSRRTSEGAVEHVSLYSKDEFADPEVLPVGSVESLCELLAASGVNVDKFGAPGTTYKSVQTLHQELTQGKCCLKRTVDSDEGVSVRREMEVMRVKLMCDNLILCETHEQLSDGRLRSRNGYLPASKKRHGETLLQTMDRWSVEELQLPLTEDQKLEAVHSCVQSHDITTETMSYPLPCATNYLEVCITLLPEKMGAVTLERLGLPAGTMFSTQSVKKQGVAGGATKAAGRSFWSWYRTEVWEAMTQKEVVELPDIDSGMEALFKGHPHRKAYEALLLQMFDSFSAWKLCGGMSGSLVLQVQPVDPIDGRNEEAVIVKLDKADVISREIVNSKRVCNVLSDRAARILGDGCFFSDDSSVEYGAFKIELAGGCWQVPELAHSSGSKDLLSTFKDLLTLESERQVLHADMHNLRSARGDVEVVLRELLGPNGMLRVLRREGLARAPRNLFSSYNYNGKDTKWNPFVAPGHFLRTSMQSLWRRTFGTCGHQSELPDVRSKVLSLVGEGMAAHDQTPLGKYKPIIGLAHGDLNAMNVLIDVMDAVWIIDFAFSEEKPVCWDLAKLEIAFMFEYAVLPVCWRTFLELAGDTVEEWRARKVHAWLGTSEATTHALLQELLVLRQRQDAHADGGVPEREGQPEVANELTGHSQCSRTTLPKRRGVTMTPEYLELATAIQTACRSTLKDSNSADRAAQRQHDTELCRMCARLLATQEEEISAFSHAVSVTDAMLFGSRMRTVMDPPAVAPGGPEGASLTFCWEKCERLRRYFNEEWQTLRRRVKRELGGVYVADESPLVFWLGLLQESHRLLGYFDVSPWVKVFAVYYLDRLVMQITSELANAGTALDRLIVGSSREKFGSMPVESFAPRPFPDSTAFGLRRLALANMQATGLPDTRAHIRSTHLHTAIYSSTGGLFAEILAIGKATFGNEAPSLETVLSTRGGEEGYDSADSDDCYNLELDGRVIGTVELVRRRTAHVRLHTRVAPLPVEVLSQEAHKHRTHVVIATAKAEGPEAGDEGLITVELTVSRDAVFCYPQGSRLQLAPNNVSPLHSGMKLRHATIINFNERSGNYRIRWDNQDSSLPANDMEANPLEGNHLVAPSFQHRPRTRLVLYREPIGFVDVAVVNQVDEGGCLRYQVRAGDGNLTVDTTCGSYDSSPRSQHSPLNPQGDHSFSPSHGTPSSSRLQGEFRIAEDKPEEWIVDLNDFNHAQRCSLDAAAILEEVKRYRVWAKGRHSMILTVTSERADCLEGPVPRIADEGGRQLFFWSECQALISEDDERVSSHLFFQGFLIVGPPGSGKSCVLCKLVMYCLSQSKMLLPVLIPVGDLCTRLLKTDASSASRQVCGSDLPVADGEALVDWYLGAVHGEDSPRYFMLRQAFQSHRLVILFDGLEEAGALSSRLERSISALVTLNHRIVATARTPEPVCPATPTSPRRFDARSARTLQPWWLRISPGLFRVVDLLPLERLCRKSLTEVLLSREPEITSEDTSVATNFCEDFLSNLQDEDERTKWSTPMMVSILVASWREKKRADLQLQKSSFKKRQFTRRNSSNSPTRRCGQQKVLPCHPGSPFGLTPPMTPKSLSDAYRVDSKSVYNVALDLLLRRSQSRHQADRHKMKATVQKFRELLELVATKMTERRKRMFCEDDVMPLLEENGMEAQVWLDISEAIREDRLPMLQVVDNIEGAGGSSMGTCGKEWFIFAYASFQQFLTIQSPRRSNYGNKRRASIDLGSALTRGDADQLRMGNRHEDDARRYSFALDAGANRQASVDKLVAEKEGSGLEDGENEEEEEEETQDEEESEEHEEGKDKEKDKEKGKETEKEKSNKDVQNEQEQKAMEEQEEKPIYGGKVPSYLKGLDVAANNSRSCATNVAPEIYSEDPLVSSWGSTMPPLPLFLLKKVAPCKYSRKLAWPSPSVIGEPGAVVDPPIVSAPAQQLRLPNVARRC